MNVLLLGYYGHRNIGDDLFVRHLIHFLSHKSKKIFLICDDTYYKRDYLSNTNIEFYHSQEISKFQRLALILKSNYIAWGGGTLAIDQKPGNLILIKRVSQLFGKKFGFLGIGLEGANDSTSTSVKSLYDSSNFLYLRDTQSYEFAVNNFKSPKICCSGGDLAFLDLSFYSDFTKLDKNPTIQKLSFSGKHWWGDSRAKFYAQPLLELIEKYNTQIHLLPGNVDSQTNDNKFHEKMLSFLPQENCTIHSWNQPEDFLSILSQMDFHIGNRLHSIILADILGVPNIGINAKPAKIRNYIQKTATLIDERTTDFMEEITLERIEKVFQNYKQPLAFIENESKTAQTCLAQVFGAI